ncbi:hypothetical protein LAUMK191_04745 [Mycobacterium attenuatum]|nr:hypothetical protein LAUMK191_04745 [Mycobacterium attenuatum]VBA61532.1 hypothetical protein LAUMK41_04912 [Mycobacterium attenuatum]
MPADESAKYDDAACEIGTRRRAMSHSPHLPQPASGICVGAQVTTIFDR